nr:hypothetical protein [Tanacetum cinerariifolium]
MALPPRNERHEWLRLDEIEDGDLDMTERLRMQHKGDDGEVLIMSFVWRDLLGIHGPLVTEIILEFFSTLWFKEGILDLDIADTFQFLLDGFRRLEPLRRLRHRLISFTISGRGHALEKVTTTNLFFLRSMDEGTVADPAPQLAPQMPQPAALAPRTIAQRLHRLKEEVQ